MGSGKRTKEEPAASLIYCLRHAVEVLDEAIAECGPGPIEPAIAGELATMAVRITVLASALEAHVAGAVKAKPSSARD